MAASTSLVGFANLVITPLREVPASEPLTPAFAIRPSAVVVSFIEYPIAPAVAATFLKDSPSKDTFVFDFDAATAKTSANSPLSLAFNPKAVKASVTISDTPANSSPLAAARFIIPAIPSIICDEFQPAIPIYDIASDASIAENLVLAPISFAFSESAVSSAPVAPEIADTFAIPCSNSLPVFTTSLPKSIA